jgi:RNA polymerase sigma factor (sigma-70 family)
VAKHCGQMSSSAFRFGAAAKQSPTPARLSGVDELERLYHDRYVGFRNALATVTGSYDTARDAVQEGFARAIEHREDFRGGSLAAWVWRIALRAALDGHRRDRGMVNSLPQPSLLESSRDPMLDEAVRALPPRRRLIVFLRYFADFSYEEIAEACGVRIGTVAATLAQARTQLAEALEKEEGREREAAR